MAIAKKRKKSTYITSDGFSYLTKRLLVQKAKSAGRTAASQAMNIMGYVVTVKEGWLIKEKPDGSTEKLQKI